MFGWHHRLDGHEFEQALGDGEGQGSLACCSPWVTESDTIEQLNNNREQTYKSKAWSPIIWGTKYENVANQLLIIYKNLLFII